MSRKKNLPKRVPTALPAFDIEVWPIDRPKAYERNARTHSKEQIRQLRSSLAAYGQVWPILVREDGTIIAGHGRLEAAKAEGMTEIRVIVATGWSEEQCRAFGVLDNKVALNSEWDDALLATELVELSGFGVDLAMLGFDPEELARLQATGGHTGLTDPDDAPTPPSTPVSTPGDLWALGRHRLLCGDATCAEQVVRLMGDERAGLMNTDPPYGVGYANDERPNPGVAKPRVAKPRVANDALADGALQEFLEAAFRAAKNFALKENAAWYLWHAHLTQGFFAAAAAAAAAVILHRQIIWVKPVLLLGRGQYHWKHEPCFMGWVEGNRPPDYGLGNGERTQTTVWEINGVTQAERREFNHATPKPVALFDIPIRKHLLSDELCYDPFAGSGPQIIAAEMTGRRCSAIDIDPTYVDVCIKRWQAFTGQKATLDGDGRAFDEIAAERLPAAA